MRWAIRKIKAAYFRVWRLPKKVLIPSGVLLVAVFAFGGFKMASAYDYMQNNPEFCRRCHIMEKAWDRWYTSEHRSVNCHECHELSMFGGAGLLLKTAFGFAP